MDCKGVRAARTAASHGPSGPPLSAAGLLFLLHRRWPLPGRWKRAPVLPGGRERLLGGESRVFTATCRAPVAPQAWRQRPGQKRWTAKCRNDDEPERGQARARSPIIQGATVAGAGDTMQDVPARETRVHPPPNGPTEGLAECSAAFVQLELSLIRTAGCCFAAIIPAARVERDRLQYEGFRHRVPATAQRRPCGLSPLRCCRDDLEAQPFGTKLRRASIWAGMHLSSGIVAPQSMRDV